MFPTGRGSSPGSPGKSHSVSDFEKLAAARKKAARSAARLKAGHDAWREVSKPT